MSSHAFLVFLVVIKTVSGFLNLTTPNTAFDRELYEAVLDPELCHQQVRHLRRNPLQGFLFADAGMRIPRGLLTGGIAHLGNYDQCLSINLNTSEFNIQGKYCLIHIPLEQSFHLPWSSDGIVQENFNLDDETKKLLGDYNQLKTRMKILSGQNVKESPIPPEINIVDFAFTFGVCIPKPCSTHQAMTSFLFNLTAAVGFQFEEEFCRLPDDKPWVGADTAFVVILSIIGFVTLLSTSYDLHHIFVRKRDPKKANKLCQTFSLYTNGKRLGTFSSHPDRLDCLDGIRSVAILLVIALHTLVTENFIANGLDVLLWIVSWKVVWLTSSPLAADTFLMIAGLLVVYNTAGYISGTKLLKNLHIFYLKRLLRIFPLLALTVLLQASILNRMFDGPYWMTVAEETHACREFWWATLLHVQNYITPNNMCLSHSWYMAVEVQLYIISPLVLSWVLSRNKTVSWFTLTGSTLAVIVASTAFIMTQNFPGGIVVLNRPDDMHNFMVNYYYNTLTRAGPFFVGMIFGYLMYLWKGKKPKINLFIVLLLWICTFTILGLVVYSVYEIKQFDWENQVVDNLVNAFSRSGWALGLGWMIFACVHGYAGPINWFLTHSVWKLPSRLSYAMYLLHFPLQNSINGALVEPTFLKIIGLIMRFLSFYSLTMVVAAAATLFFDYPFCALFRLILGNGMKKQKPVNDIVKDEKNGETSTTKEE